MEKAMSVQGQVDVLDRVRDIIEAAIREHCAGGDLWLCADLAARKVVALNDEPNLDA